MIDLHSHLLTGVDDGATNGEESRAALATLHEQGVRTVVVTPHLRASLVRREAAFAEYMARVDAAWAELRAVAGAYPEMQLRRGFEIMLDVPDPELGDARLRLGGTSFVLVEFAYLSVPPNARQVLYGIHQQGLTPVVAHPERYQGMREAIHRAEEWRASGARLQVNAGSLLGRYGPGPREVAWRLLARGWGDYVASDFHARGMPRMAAARAALEQAGGALQARLLMEENPARLLAGEPPLPVPPLRPARLPLWRRFLGRRAG
jgi:protein-tyrosine phosphatase